MWIEYFSEDEIYFLEQKDKLSSHLINKIKVSHKSSKSRADDISLTVRILLSVHSRASSLASRVTSSEASAMALAQAIKSRLVPPSPRTSWDRRPISKAIFLAAAMIALSLLDHCFTSWCRPCAANCNGSNSLILQEYKRERKEQLASCQRVSPWWVDLHQEHGGTYHPHHLFLPVEEGVEEACHHQEEAAWEGPYLLDHISAALKRE